MGTGDGQKKKDEAKRREILGGGGRAMGEAGWYPFQKIRAGGEGKKGQKMQGDNKFAVNHLIRTNYYYHY